MMSPDEVASAIINAGAISIRDVDSGELPFVYSTGNRGPGYLMIKGLVGQPAVLKKLTKSLAYKVIQEAEFDFIEGNATGGMIPGWQLRNDVSGMLGKEIPYCYLRGSRKEGGHGELITGNQNNPLIKNSMKVLIVEELVNYAKTTTNAAEEFRAVGYLVSHGACILSYDLQEANERLKEREMSLVSLVKLPDLLNVAETNNQIPREAINSYRNFLKNTVEWQLSRGLIIPGGIKSQELEGSAKKAVEMGHKMRKLSGEEALKMGAPEGKIKEGIVYWAKIT